MRARLVATTLLLVAVAASAQARTSSQRAQLDADTPIERIQRVIEACPANVAGAPGGCGYIRVLDGDIVARITPETQWPQADYGWIPAAAPRFADLTGDGRPEIVWHLLTAGGTGDSAERVGVHRWTGRRAVELLATGGRGRDGLAIGLDVLAPRNGLRELRLVELVYRRHDSPCCPSFRRTTRYRFDGRRMAPVRGSSRVERLHS